jgi:hypothetical protein
MARSRNVRTQEESPAASEEGTIVENEMTAVDEQPNSEETMEETVEAPEPTVEELKARVAELEAKLAEKSTKQEKKKPTKRKHDLPEGYIAPVAFRHALVERGLAAESMSPVQIYSLARKASSNGMPVKHFDREGKTFDEIQTHPVTGATLTRPGLKLDEGLEWWQNRPKRQPGEKVEKSEDEKASEADVDAAENLEDAAALEEDEEGFVEAE